MNVRRSRARRPLAWAGGALTLALLAAACGGDDSSKSAASSTTAATTASSASASTASTASSTSAAAAAKPTSIEDWQKVWDTERAAAVKKIKDNGWGVQADKKTLTGPDGMKVDLGACGAGWDNTAGLTDTEIKLGFVLAQSGTLAEAANAAKAQGIYFDAVNKAGGIKDANGKTRLIKQESRDDAYDPAKTIPLVDEMIDSVKAFAVQTLGSANVLRTMDKFSQRCVPNAFAIVGHPAAGDPVNHPWTTGILLTYSTEGILWGNFIENHLSEFPGGKVTIGAVALANDSGKAFDAALKAYIAQSPKKDSFKYTSQFIEPTAPTVTDQMTTVAAAKPDVFISMTTGTICSQTVTAAAENGLAKATKYNFVASVCKGFVTKAAVGDASDGYWIMGGGVRTFISPGEAANPFVAYANGLVKAAGLDPLSSTQYATGFLSGLPIVQSLRIASDLPGGLTRANYLLAVRTLDFSHPAYLDGIKFNLSGNKDAYPVEGSEIARWSSANQAWTAQGGVIELSGKSSPCAWDTSTSTCK